MNKITLKYRVHIHMLDDLPCLTDVLTAFLKQTNNMIVGHLILDKITVGIYKDGYSENIRMLFLECSIDDRDTDLIESSLGAKTLTDLLTNLTWN